MFVRIHTCVCMYAHVSKSRRASAEILFPNNCAYLCVNICTYTYVCMHICTCVRVKTRPLRSCFQTSVKMYVYICTYSYVCVCMYAHVSKSRRASAQILLPKIFACMYIFHPPINSTIPQKHHISTNTHTHTYLNFLKRVIMS